MKGKTMQTRRIFLASSIGAAVVLPYASLAASKGFDTFQGDAGDIVVHPIYHSSFVLQVPGLVIYNDPVGNASAYAHLPPPDLILISHHHKDHFVPRTLNALMAKGTKILANPTVYGRLSKSLKAAATSIGNGKDIRFGDVRIEAVPAYNNTPKRAKYHPKGRDNGYIVNASRRRVYIAGDTEDVPEMRTLKNIDVAFLPMILPYTMDGAQAASAVEAIRPAYVYPYHYNKANVDKFVKLMGQSASGTQVKRGAWYS
jgi:L-ascorbate metabolism protein UlaG (beta-lactamase superfamily)